MDLMRNPSSHLLCVTAHRASIDAPLELVHPGQLDDFVRGFRARLDCDAFDNAIVTDRRRRKPLNERANLLQYRQTLPHRPDLAEARTVHSNFPVK